MSEEFHEWLSQCPAAWYRIHNEEKGVCAYTFVEVEE